MWVGQYENFISFQFNFLWQKISLRFPDGYFSCFTRLRLRTIIPQSMPGQSRPRVALEGHTTHYCTGPLSLLTWPVLTTTCQSMPPPGPESSLQPSNLLTLISQTGWGEDTEDSRAEEDEPRHAGTAGGGGGGGGQVSLTPTPSRLLDSEWLRERASTVQYRVGLPCLHHQHQQQH